MSTGVLMHYGKSKKDGAIIGSGRYPLGSGDDPYQHEEGQQSLFQNIIYLFQDLCSS